MSETPDSPAATSGDAAKKRGGGLSTMLLADLKAMAAGMGVPGAAGMKKAQLIEAIKAGQGAPVAAKKTTARKAPAAAAAPAADPAESSGPASSAPKKRTRTAKKAADAAPELPIELPSAPEPVEAAPKAEAPQTEPEAAERRPEPKQSSQTGQTGQTSQTPPQQPGHDQQDANDDGEPRTGRNRRRRGRDRSRTTTGAAAQPGNQSPDNQGGNPGNQGKQSGQQSGHQSNRHEPDTSILDDDVLVPAAGILDVLDNYAFVRTSGYLPGPDDVYVSLSMVRKYGLRRGDAIVGQVRQPREGERKEKFNPMVRIEGVNGGEPEAARTRPDFAKLTPLHPTERLRLETGPDNLVGRVLDLAAPVGKGQRGLVVAPGGSGKTQVLQSIASSISANNPECHLMVILVDERPEEVTDFQRAVKGEVISSTFDRPPADHTILAELAIERAKRLVELGHDVVILLDGITRLTRAYNVVVPPSGRLLAGVLDAAAVHPPKRFFGAARNVEHGGSLTILATATGDHGSALDAAVLEEFAGTSTSELRLSRDLADRRLFPAVDVVHSGTRHEELLMGEEEVAIIGKLRRVLSTMDGRHALEGLLGRLQTTQTNIEFLMQVQKASSVDALLAGKTD